MADMTQFSGQKKMTAREVEIVQAQYYRLVRQGRAIRENRSSIKFIWDCLEDPVIMASAAMEAYDELHSEDQIALWVAPSKGGIWESWERDVLKYGEVKQTYLTAMKRKGIPVPTQLERHVRQSQRGRRSTQDA